LRLNYSKCLEQIQRKTIFVRVSASFELPGVNYIKCHRTVWRICRLFHHVHDQCYLIKIISEEVMREMISPIRRIWILIVLMV